MHKFDSCRGHEGDAAFEAWQASLREAVRGLEVHSVDSAEFTSRATEYLKDELEPQMRELERSLMRGLRDSFVREEATVAVGGATLYDVALDLPVSKAAFAGLPAAAAAAARLIVNGFFGDKAKGANAILAQLMRNPRYLPRK